MLMLATKLRVRIKKPWEQCLGHGVEHLVTKGLQFKWLTTRYKVRKNNKENIKSNKRPWGSQAEDGNDHSPTYGISVWYLCKGQASRTFCRTCHMFSSSLYFPPIAHIISGSFPYQVLTSRPFFLPLFYSLLHRLIFFIPSIILSIFLPVQWAAITLITSLHQPSASQGQGGSILLITFLSPLLTGVVYVCSCMYAWIYMCVYPKCLFGYRFHAAHCLHALTRLDLMRIK